MSDSRLAGKQERFDKALELFLERVREDKTILGVVLVGSLTPETIVFKSSIGVWIIEVDGVSKRLKSDGSDERIFRILTEEGVNLHAELIPRSRFKLMVEGASRTAFSCNFFERRELIYCCDPSIETWFERANTAATKDQDKERLVVASWAIHACRAARRYVEYKDDLELARQHVLWAAHCLAALQIVKHGQIQESDVLYRAIELEPELFEVIYTSQVQKTANKKRVLEGIARVEDYLLSEYEANFKPLLRYLRKQRRTVPLTEISDAFAYSQLYPHHLESVCEWLERQGLIEKVSTPFKLTKKSRVDVEEPAYELHD